MDWMRFLKEVKRQVQPVYLFYGNEPYFLQRVLESLKDAFLGGEGEFVTFYGNEVDKNILFSELNTLPLMSQRKLVCIRQAEKLPKAAVDSLVGFIERPAEGVCLALVDERGFEEGVRKRKKSYIEELHGIVRKKGALVELASPKGQAEYIRWIKMEAKRLGFSMSTRGAYFLLERVGENLSLLRQELEKLAGYGREGEVVDAEEVEEVVVSRKEERVYELFDAIIARDAKKALSILASAYKQGMHPLQVLALLEREVFKVMDVKVMLEEGAELPQYGSRSKRVAGRISWERINQILSTLLEADVSTKSVGLHPERVVELMLIKLCTKSPTHPERIQPQWRQGTG